MSAPREPASEERDADDGAPVTTATASTTATATQKTISPSTIAETRSRTFMLDASASDRQTIITMDVQALMRNSSASQMVRPAAGISLLLSLSRNPPSISGIPENATGIRPTAGTAINSGRTGNARGFAQPTSGCSPVRVMWRAAV